MGANMAKKRSKLREIFDTTIERNKKQCLMLQGICWGAEICFDSVIKETKKG